MRRLHPNDSQGWLSRERLRALALLIGTALALYLCYRLAEPFLQSLALALALAVVAYPLHAALLRRLHRPGLAAALTATAIGLVVVAPAFLIGQHLVHEAARTGAAIQWWLGPEGSATLLERHPVIAPLWGWAGSFGDIPTATGELVKAQAPSAVAATMWTIVNLLVAFFVLFYFLRDHRTALARVGDLVPLADDEIREMIEVVRDTIRAIVFGTVVVALVQGALGGLMFWLLGLPSPLLWAVIMALLAMIPYLGAFLVWLPAAILLAMRRKLGKGAPPRGLGHRRDLPRRQLALSAPGRLEAPAAYAAGVPGARGRCSLLRCSRSHSRTRDARCDDRTSGCVAKADRFGSDGRRTAGRGRGRRRAARASAASFVRTSSGAFFETRPRP